MTEAQNFSNVEEAKAFLEAHRLNPNYAGETIPRPDHDDQGMQEWLNKVNQATRMVNG